jgi:DNA invertase Pin-like site-specific DNA recombinase
MANGHNIGYIRVSSVDKYTARQLEGILEAKKQGKYKGRSKCLTQEKLT